MVCKAEQLKGDLSFENLSKLNDNGMSSVHYHNAYEIYYLQDGNRGYDIKDKTFRVKKGNLILIDKFKRHKTFNDSNDSFNRMLVKFKETSLGSFKQGDYDLLSSFNKDINIIQFDAKDRIMVENIFAKMEAEKRKNKPGQNLYLKTLLIELLIYVNRYVDGKYIDQKERDYHVKIVEIMNYIDQNFYKKLTLSKLADKFSYSSSYLSSLFKEKSDYTITEYINNTRIKEAQNLLLKGKDNITKISERVGYNNLVHFGRNFKKITGLTPSEYRKCYKNN
ncbi:MULTISPECIES: AraC family transcriptional regulator [Halanaerobium]|jgi:YesN/AraC family two-component response regulator|uniref:AraC-like ligand binding domain-containing protein n=1 Tax=Halanaerobium kushneri TaxID=56779 RepID=A0A1N6R6K1_9FIRM|nr:MULTISPECIES: helix-turn-helix domain-containing protein [Halanaerobium]RCW61840.1 AraC-like protein [Halanaerobium sp. ST460_2HS_T2]SIQ24469.1 AraC-like ligand binding domain-containing protein [Halanaerobium kushneri]